MKDHIIISSSHMFIPSNDKVKEQVLYFLQNSKFNKIKKIDKNTYMSNSLQLLKTKRFLPLFITQFFGAFNDNAFKNAFLIWFTYDVAVESKHLDPQLILTIAAGLFILPFFLFSATASQLTNKYEKSKLVQIIKQIEILLC